MAVKFWTRAKLTQMRDKILPQERSLAAAVRVFEQKYNRKLSVRQLTLRFREELGTSPGAFLASAITVPEHTEELPPLQNPVFLNKRISTLEKELVYARDEAKIANIIRSVCHKGVEYIAEPPEFLIRPPKRQSSLYHGVPTLFLSDLHHGEQVYTEQVNYANDFDMEISRRRIRRVFERTVYLTDNVLTPCDYPGIVVPMGGDMVSGNIHDEIRESNEMPIFDVVLDLVDILRGGINLLLERFPSVYCPCVVGNHGRLDRKPRMKNGPQDNYEYIMYHLLAEAFSNEPRVTSGVSDSFTAHYRIYNTRYLLTHGDQFRGGSGIAGPATPWALGDHKLRKQMASIEGWTERPVEYDVLLIGHFHQLTYMKSMIVNGSTKGFCEFAKKMNFSFEPPKQALWFTTEDRGKSIPLEIFVEDKKDIERGNEWVSIIRP